MRTGGSEADLDESKNSVNILIGIALSVGAGAMLAASMNVQQWALTSPSLEDNQRYRVWLGGLFLYCLAQFICTGALSFCPLSLVAALFTTMLIWDALIGRYLLKKTMPLSGIVGLCIIFTSVVMVAVFGPKEEYGITDECLLYWIQEPSGVVTIVCLMLVFSGNYVIYRWFTKEYPYFRDVDPHNGKRLATGVISDNLTLLMQVVYPAILACTETLGSLSLKALSSMVLSAFATEDYSQLRTVVFFVLCFVYIGAVASIMLWLRIVYAKFATAECLATEYGLVAVFSIFASLLFFQEHKDPNANLLVIGAACCFILVGISVLVVGGRLFVWFKCFGQFETQQLYREEVEMRHQIDVAITSQIRGANHIVSEVEFHNNRDKVKEEVVQQVLAREAEKAELSGMKEIGYLSAWVVDAKKTVAKTVKKSLRSVSTRRGGHRKRHHKPQHKNSVDVQEGDLEDAGSGDDDGDAGGGGTTKVTNSPGKGTDQGAGKRPGTRLIIV
jgi:drug/metabolite transporter (DMT)-like permease